MCKNQDVCLKHHHLHVKSLKVCHKTRSPLALLLLKAQGVKHTIDHFTVANFVPWPSSECEAEGDLVLIQTSFALLWKLSLKSTS